jgi:ATP-dependent RNA helicase RhlE
MNFTEMKLPPSIGRELSRMNFIQPTPIQEQAIPLILSGRDLVGLAQTGTGKTGAFGIPMAARLLSNSQAQALVLAPTRELAMQIHQFLKTLCGQEIRCGLIIGGQSVKQDLRELGARPRILVATPGRLMDHMRKNPKLLSRISMLVLDEADRMLDMGFLPQIRTIIRGVPRERQTLMFSATFAGQVKELANSFLKNPERVTVGAESKPIEKIEQAVVQTSHKQKNEVLLDELNAREGAILIFARTKHRTDRLCRYLDSYGFKVGRLHGDRSQSQRKQAIEALRSGRIRILVATDIASRGLDIDGIEHVINYDLPQVAEDYVHRIGRTARNGREGKSLALLVPEDKVMWREISRLGVRATVSN